MDVRIKSRLKPLWLLALIALLTGFLWGIFPMVAHAEDNSSTVPGNPTYTEDAFYYSDQYMWKVSLFVAKSDTVNKDSSNMNDFYRIGNQAVYLNPVKNMSQWMGGARPSSVSGLFFSKENKVDTLKELQSKGGDVNALDPVEITTGNNVNMITGVPNLPFVPQLSDGDIYDNGVIYGDSVGSISKVVNYFNSSSLMFTLLNYYAGKQGVSKDDLIKSLEFTIDGETRTGWNPEGILPNVINDNPTNQVEWLVVYEPVSIVYVKDTAHPGSYYGYALSATDFAVSQIKHQMDWRYDETRWTAWAGQQPDAWKANANRQHVSRLAFLLMGNSVITSSNWYGLTAGPGVDQNAAIPFNRWFSDQQTKFGGWGMSRWIKPAEFEKPRDNDYRPNTDVILSTPVYSNINATPGSELTVTYKINGEVIGTDSLVAPMKTESYSYIKWHTPDVNTVTSYDLEMSISPYPEGTINCGGNEYTHRTLTIRPLEESTPPDPKVGDTIPTDLPANLVPPSSVPGEDTADETVAPVIKSIKAVTEAPYYKNETVKIEVVTNRATKNLTFTNTDSGVGKQFGSDSLGDGMLISRSVNELANEIVWTIEFVPANLGANHYAFKSLNAAAGESEVFSYDVEVVVDPDIPVIYDVLINPVQALYTLYEEVIKTPLAYEVYFNTNGGNEMGAQNAEYNTLLTEPGQPTREGYSFKGWFKDPGFAYSWNFESDRIIGVTTLYAKWEINTYLVHFDPQGGSDTFSPITVEYGSNIEEPTPSPTRSYYVFGGWFKDIACITPWIFTEDTITGNTTLYGKWDATALVVTFDSLGGSLIETQNADYDAFVIKPDDPQKVGFTFKGWYQDSACNTVWTFASDRVKADLTLYAKWDVNLYTVTFDSLGGSVVPDQTVQNDTITTKPTDPVRSGYSFQGWFKEDSCENAWDFSTDKITGDTTLFALWTADEAAIEFIVNNGTDVPKMVGATDREILDTTMPITVRDGYSFSGWYASSDFSGDSVTSLPGTYPIGTTIYYAKWTPNEAFIEFQANDGSDVSKMTGVTDQIISPTTMPTTSRSGYTFSGWYASVDFSGDVITALPSKYPIGTTIYYAKWTPNISTIKFISNGGSAVDDLIGVTDQDITDTTMPISTWEHYTLEGWYASADFSGDVVTALPEKYPVDGITYYAKWSPIKYTLTFDSQEGSAVDQQMVDYDTFAFSPSSPARSGYTFTGWFRDAGCTTLWNFSADKIIEDTTLYAGWNLGIPDASVPLNNWSWEQINQVAELGLGENYFDIGEEKDIIVNGETLTLQIYGFDHDTLADGTENKTNITFGLKNLMAGSKQMDTEIFNNGGWNLSDLRVWTNGTLYNELPSDLKGLVSTVNKKTSSGAGSSSIVTSTDKIFIFSEEELFGTTYNAFAGEGSLYPIFTTDASRIKKLNNGLGLPSGYWERSPVKISGYHYCGVLSNGNYSGGGQANAELGVNFGFAIGNAPTNTYSVNYNSNGGSAVTSTTATLNMLLAEPTSTKSGFTLYSWYKDSGLAQKWDFATDKLDGDTTLYAKWGATITFDSQGGTAVPSILTECGKTISAPSSPSRNGYVFKGWYKESSCLTAWNFAVDQPIGDRSLYAKWVEGIPDSSVPLNNWSWNQIQQVADLGLAQDYFVIGESKDITLSTGEVLTLLIYDFNHDTLADGTTNKSNITFGLKNLMKDDRQYDTYSNYAGSWAGSAIRSWTNGTLNGQLPSEVQNMLKPVNKYTAGGYASQTIVTTSDKLFLFSEVEMFGSNWFSYTGEGYKYPIFTNDDSRIKTQSIYGNTWYWNRSPVDKTKTNTGPGYLSYVQNNGKAWFMDASGWIGVNFGFCIGNAPTNTYTVNFDSSGGSAVTSTTATINTTIAEPTAPTNLDGSKFDGWYKDSGLTSKFDFSADKITGDTTLYAKWKTLPAVGQALSAYTWDEIGTIADEGLGDVYFDVGASKDMTLSTGEVVTMQIYGFDHDDLASGGGKANITFGTKDLMATPQFMNPQQTNNYGWDGSELRGYLNGINTTNATSSYTVGLTSVYAQIPADLKSQITDVKKKTSGGYNNQPIVTSIDHLFSFSEVEVFGTNNLSPAGEGAQYPVFINAASRIKYMNHGLGSANWWHLRSPLYNDAYGSFLVVSTSGYVSNVNATIYGSVTFGFCMGTAKDMPDVGTALKDCSWQQVANVANAGKGDDYWNIGDTKDMTLSTGEVVTMQVYDFNHDDKSDGNGKTNITFGTQNLMANTRAINPGNNTNFYGWEGSDLRGWMNGVSTTYAGTNYTSGTTSLYAQLPVEIQSGIKPANKYTSGGYNNPTNVTSKDKIFTFSEVELYGTNTNSIIDEGTRYPIFTDNASLIKNISNGSGIACHYWGRSTPLNSGVSFLGVYPSGSKSIINADNYIGVAFGFCFGTAPSYLVNFDSQGGSAVTAISSQSQSNATAPATPTKSGMTFAGWFKDAAGTTEWNFTTDKVTGPTTLYAKWITLPTLGTSLEACSWDQIAYISKAGLADTYFDVGNTKNITLSTNEVLTMQIYDFNHDDKSDGSGKAGITFGTKDLMTIPQVMNPTNTNYYGWEGSQLRGFMNGISTTYAGNNYTSGTTSLYSELPTAIQSAIKPVKKLTSGGYNNNVLLTSTDKLFAFSEVELNGSTNFSNAGEGVKYSIFTNNASRIKKMSNGSGSAYDYWDRSPYTGNGTAYALVHTDGSYIASSAGSAYGVAFGFCI